MKAFIGILNVNQGKSIKNINFQNSNLLLKNNW